LSGRLQRAVHRRAVHFIHGTLASTSNKIANNRDAGGAFLDLARHRAERLTGSNGHAVIYQRLSITRKSLSANDVANSPKRAASRCGYLTSVLPEVRISVYWLPDAR
jgi:hypothetical protein